MGLDLGPARTKLNNPLVYLDLLHVRILLLMLAPHFSNALSCRLKPCEARRTKYLG
jgi:hypothetical protein